MPDSITGQAVNLACLRAFGALGRRIEHIRPDPERQRVPSASRG